MADELTAMHGGLSITSLSPAASSSVPSLFADASEHGSRRFLEFFVATIRNANTRRAYFHAATRFAVWCDSVGLTLTTLSPLHAAAYVELLSRQVAAPSAKQHLAALRMLFDWLVIGQVVSVNPLASVRGPSHVVKTGKTPVLSREEARHLLDSIDSDTLIGRRDRALIGIMIYSFARVGAVVAMNVEDYWQQGKRGWLRFQEKGGKHLDLPAHHKVEEFIDAYLDRAGIAVEKGTPLFRSFSRQRTLTARRLDRREVHAMSDVVPIWLGLAIKFAATAFAPPASRSI
jgi:integrase/recombinase XerD